MDSDPSTPNIQSLPFLFDRPRSQHPWSAGLSGMSKQSIYGHGAIAANWRMDFRVSGAREQQLLEASRFSGQTDPSRWWSERLAYFQHYLCLPSVVGPSTLRSAYLDDQNAGNAIPAGTLPGHERLIHVASLNSILWRLSGGSYLTIDLEERLFDLTGFSLPARGIGTVAPGVAGFDSQVETIAEALKQLCTGRVERIAQAPMLDHNQLNSLRNRQRQRLADESTHQRDQNWLQRHAPTT